LTHRNPAAPAAARRQPIGGGETIGIVKQNPVKSLAAGGPFGLMNLEIEKEIPAQNQMCRGSIIIFAMPDGTAKWADRYR